MTTETVFNEIVEDFFKDKFPAQIKVIDTFGREVICRLIIRETKFSKGEMKFSKIPTLQAIIIDGILVRYRTYTMWQTKEFTVLYSFKK